MGYLLKDEENEFYTIGASEGGHQDYTAKTEEDFALREYFKKKLGNSELSIEAAKDFASASDAQACFIKPWAVTKSSQMDEKVSIWSSPSFGKNTSPPLPRMHANIQIWPLSSGDTKYRFTSDGAANGCFF